MKRIKILLQVFLVTLLVLSCTKNEEEKINQINNKSLLSQKVLEKEELILIGKNHNSFLINYYKNKTQLLEKTELTEKELLINDFMEAKDFDWNDVDSQKSLEYVIDESIKMGDNNYSVDDYINNFNLTGKDFITRLDENLLNASDINEFNKNADLIIQEITISNLSIEEKNGILGYAYIMKSSAKLWSPVSIGGDGLFDELNSSNEFYARKKWSWRRAARGDAAGSMTFFLGIGLTIIAPPAGAAVLTGWAWSAAAGSVVAGSGII